MKRNQSLLISLVAQGASVEDAGRASGYLSSKAAWDAYDALSRGVAAAGNREMFAAVGLDPEDLGHLVKDGFSATKFVMVEGGTKDTPAVFEEVADHPTRLRMADFFARLTGIDPGEKVTIEQKSVSLNIDLRGELSGKSGEDLLKALRGVRLATTG